MDFSTITETLERIKNKEISIKELNEIFIKRIKDSTALNAFIYFDENKIYDQIKKIENQNDNFSLNVPVTNYVHLLFHH